MDILYAHTVITMAKKPEISLSAYRRYTGEELFSLHQQALAINYSREDILREAAQLNKRLEELRDRWKYLGQRKKQIDYILQEHKFNASRHGS